MLVGIDGILIGTICVGIPMCVYAIIKDCKRESNEKEEQYTKEQLEITKLKVELEKLRSANKVMTDNTNTDVKGMF